MSSPDTLLILPLPEMFGDEVFRIETQRLWLRWPSRADAARLQEIATHEIAARGAGCAPHPLVWQDAVAGIAAARTANEAGSALVMVLAPKSTPGTAVGLVGLDVARDAALSASFLLDVGHQGRGYMTEAMRGLADAAFAFGRHRVIRTPTGVANHAARRMLEKSGFRAVGDTGRMELSRRKPIERRPTNGGDAALPCACAA